MSEAMSANIEKSTFAGNGGRDGYALANCGLSITNSSAPTLTVNADGNYWGAAAGPGVDPADDAGGSCDAGAVMLNLTEWVTKEIKTAPPRMK